MDANQNFKPESQNIKPEAGMGCTVCVGSDRYAATVFLISPTGFKLTVRLDQATRTDSNGFSEQQTYTYKTDANGDLHVFYRCADGRYSGERGRKLILGERRSYRDPSF